METDSIFKKWELPSPKAVFLLVHGLGSHTGRWDFLADFFSGNNISSYALQLRGFGLSPERRGHIESFDVYIDDILSLYQIIKKESPGKKIFLIGESAGALIATLTVILQPKIFDGLICLSPAFGSRLHFSFAERIKIYSSMLVNPRRQFSMPFNAQMCTRDPDYQKIIEQEPSEHRLASARFLFETLKAQNRARSLIAKISLPVLFLLAGQDKLVDPETSKMFFQGLKTKDKKLIEYPEMYHSLSVELGREKVFADILAWIDKRL